MALSIGKKNNGKADEVEARLRARLADLEGRLDDGSKIRQLEDHIRHLNDKHRLELQEAKLAAREEIDRIKTKATSTVAEAKRLIKAERARYDSLVAELGHLHETLAALEATRASLAERGLKVQLVSTTMRNKPNGDSREFVAELTRHAQELAEHLDGIAAIVGEGSLDDPTSDLEILTARTKELLTNPELRSKALTVAEKARMFGADPGKAQYYRELVLPYSGAIQKVLENAGRANVVYGAQEALAIVEMAFRDSRTFLLRRSGDLDDHSIEASVTVERLEESPEDALGRMSAVMDNARALGPVDFFHNLQMELTRCVERGEPGAKAAAWILSDITVQVLEDPVVQKWLANQR